MTITYTQRIDYIDIIKGLAIFYVVIGHVLWWTYEDWNCAKENFIGTIVWKLIYSFHMPLFMFISGYVVFSPYKHYRLVDVSKRIVQYLIPFLLVGTILYYFRNDPSGICNYWYLRALAEYVAILYFVIFLLGYFHLNDKSRNLLVVIIYVILFRLINYMIVDNTLVDDIISKKHLNMYSYFVIGWYVRRNEWIEKNIFNNELVLPISLITLFVFVVFGVYQQTLLTFSGIFATYSLGKFLEGSSISRMVMMWGKKTLEIYILHFFFLFSFPVVGNYFLKICHLPTALFMQYAYGIIISLFNVYICIYLAKVIEKNDILSFVFFGKLCLLTKYKRRSENSTIKSAS